MCLLALGPELNGHAHACTVKTKRHNYSHAHAPLDCITRPHPLPGMHSREIHGAGWGKGAFSNQ